VIENEWRLFIYLFIILKLPFMAIEDSAIYFILFLFLGEGG
jgi:hypothetical protein